MQAGASGIGNVESASVDIDGMGGAFGATCHIELSIFNIDIGGVDGALVIGCRDDQGAAACDVELALYVEIAARSGTDDGRCPVCQEAVADGQVGDGKGFGAGACSSCYIEVVVCFRCVGKGVCGGAVKLDGGVAGLRECGKIVAGRG